MADPAAALIKLIFLFNLILLGLGILIISHGLKTRDISQTNGEKIEEVDALVSSFSTVSKVLIILGIVVSVVSFSGCFGACIESPSFLSWYIFFVLLLIGFQLSVGFYVYQIESLNRDKAQDVFWNSMKKYKIDDRYKAFIDSIQSWLRCCGAKEPSDWTALLGTLPPSCCVDNKNLCDVSKSFKQNCANAINDWMQDIKSRQIWHSSVIIGFQVILIIFTCYSRNVIVERQALFSEYL